MNLQLITTPEAFVALQSEWNTLLPHNTTNEIFLTWEWQHTWWSVYCPGDLWIVAARDEAGKLIGLAPWFMEKPQNVIRTIGCVEVTDYLDLLALPEHQDAFFAALVEFLLEHRSTFSKVDLCNMPETAAALNLMPRLLSERGFSVVIKDEDVCPHINLPGDFEAYLGMLDKKQRHELRRKVRRAEENDGEKVAWYIVGPEHDLKAEMDRFLNLMAASHQNKAQFLQESRHKLFFQTIMPILFERGWLQLSFLTVNGEAAATYFNFDYNNKILVYNSGLLPATFSHLSPGIVLLVYNIQHAIEQGRREFDFLQGNEEYKYRMGGKDRAVRMLEAAL